MPLARLKKVGYLLNGARILPRDSTILESLAFFSDLQITPFTPPRQSYIQQLKWIFFTVSSNPDTFWIAGYQTHRFVPWLRFLSKKPLIYNGLCSLYEGSVLDRKEPSFMLRCKIWLIDFFAFAFSWRVLVETSAQINFLSKTFSQSKDKFVRIFTGVSNTWVDSNKTPTAVQDSVAVLHIVFRGGLQPYVGLDNILYAIKRLRNESIRWTIIGRGPLELWLRNALASCDNSNAFLRTDFIAEAELQDIMASADIALGPVSTHPRAGRTIPNKVFEYMALGIPIIAADTPSLREILTHNKSAILIDARDPETLLQAIRRLQNNIGQRRYLAANARKILKETSSPYAAATILRPLIKTWLKDE